MRGTLDDVWEQVLDAIRKGATYADVGRALAGMDVGKGASAELLAERIRSKHRRALASGSLLSCSDEDTGGGCKCSLVPDKRDDKAAMYADPVTVCRDWRGDRIIRIGVVSDPHIGSVFTQLTLLHEAYGVFRKEGIRDVYNAGDLTEGENMRQGHVYECYVHGSEQYVDEVVQYYPKVNGITTHFILGNHDLSFMKHAGQDIGRAIARERSDLQYMGISQAYIELTPKCRLEMRHPGGGSAYAISYKPQKMIDAMSGGDKPSILIVGHYHKAEYIPYRNVHCIQAGTLQAQSNFMRDHNLAAHVGYWILTVHVNDDGQINKFVPEFFPFYNMHKDDWKSVR